MLLLLGALMALLGVSELARQFRKPSLLERLRRSLLQPTGPEEHEASADMIALGKMRATMDASIRRPLDPDSPISEIVAAVEYNFEQVSDDLGKVRAEMRAADAGLDHKVSDESRRLANGVAALRQDLEDATTGGLDLTIAGLWFVIAGTVLSALPGLGVIAG